MRQVTLSAVLLVVVTAAGAHGQRAAPAYRAQTLLVRIAATVSGADGAPILNLVKEDFAVDEDGVGQEIALFTQDADTPLSIALVVDISGSMRDELAAVRTGLRDYLAGMRDEDQIGLITFGGRSRQVIGLDGSRDRLLAAIDGLRSGGGTALYEGLEAAAGMLTTSRHAKRVVLLITDGNNTSDNSSRQKATRSMRRSEALLYAVAIGHSGRETLIGRIIAKLNSPQMGLLQSWADDSGGRAALVDYVTDSGRDRLVQTIAAFGEELRRQYTLGYYPAASRSGKKVHQIRVTTRHAGQQVRARKVYSTG